MLWSLVVAVSEGEITQLIAKPSGMSKMNNLGSKAAAAQKTATKRMMSIVIARCTPRGS